ncbi:MAG: hypothetical protein DRP01_00750 [Archaeoglobales archaeon]|nr:MAG: hypothetical protein DRP01_00750 [Archaeoglobales archaeon]
MSLSERFTRIIGERLPELRRIEELKPPLLIGAYKNLYGVPIYVPERGIIGQYIDHTVFQREERWWSIRYGEVIIYGEIERKLYPIIVMGVPTFYLKEYRGVIKRRFVHERPIGLFECRESDILNLDSVLQAKDPIMIVDKFHVWRSGRIPADFRRMLAERQDIINRLLETVWRQEVLNRDLRMRNTSLEAEVRHYRSLLDEYASRIERLETEITSLHRRLSTLTEEARYQATRAEIFGGTVDRYRQITDYTLSIVDSILKEFERLTRVIEELRKVREYATE